MIDWLILSLLFYGVFLIGALFGAVLARASAADSPRMTGEISGQIPGPQQRATVPPLLVLHRHDVHHHGLPTDDLPGDEWKRP